MLQCRGTWRRTGKPGREISGCDRQHSYLTRYCNTKWNARSEKHKMFSLTAQWWMTCWRPDIHTVSLTFYRLSASASLFINTLLQPARRHWGWPSALLSQHTFHYSATPLPLCSQRSGQRCKVIGLLFNRALCLFASVLVSLNRSPLLHADLS